MRGKSATTATFTSSSLFNKVIHQRRAVAGRATLSLSTEFLIKKEALKNCVTSK
jgi:hypothetical protein